MGRLCFRDPTIIAATLLAIGMMFPRMSVIAAEPVEIKSGFLTGDVYRSLSQEGKKAYAMGILDGVFLAPFFGAEKEKLAWIEQCATGMSDSQMSAIFDKYLNDNPERWHRSMNILAWIALKEACDG